MNGDARKWKFDHPKKEKADLEKLPSKVKGLGKENSISDDNVATMISNQNIFNDDTVGMVASNQNLLIFQSFTSCWVTTNNLAG